MYVAHPTRNELVTKLQNTAQAKGKYLADLVRCPPEAFAI